MQTQKSNLTIRIEPELKKEASALFRSLGLDLSTATGIFYRQFSIVRPSDAMDFHLKSSWMNPMRLHIKQWMMQKMAGICMAHTTV